MSYSKVAVPVTLEFWIQHEKENEIEDIQNLAVRILEEYNLTSENVLPFLIQAMITLQIMNPCLNINLNYDNMQPEDSINILEANKDMIALTA